VSASGWLLVGLGVGMAYLVCAAVYLMAKDGIGWFDPRRKS
jgi:hypothetical protein